MIRNILRSKKGSTLLLIMVVLSILSMLGTAILSLSVVNFKRQIVDRDVKTSFYLAEAGLEEAHAIIGKEVENAIVEGNTVAQERLKKFIEGERTKEQKNPEVEESDFIIGKDGYGEVDKNQVDSIMNNWFKVTFAKYINGQLNDDEGKIIEDESLEKKLEDYKYGIVNNNNLKVNRIGEAIEYDINGDSVESDPYSITLQSNFIHRDIPKQIQGTFNIEIPDYNAPYYVKNIRAKINDNILWKKAITTEKNIYVKGENVTINGDIYAYGTSDSNPKDFGGIVVGEDQKGGLTVAKGNIATNSYVHTKSNDSFITINDGNVYCNTLVIHDGLVGCNIQVKGTVNTTDDLELNGRGSEIEIDGDYYGFTDGSGSVTHDNSSSIVINSDDIGSGSNLSITGNAFIAGTSYINIGSNKYQTGESVSIKGNYVAYGEYLDDNWDLYLDSDSDTRKRQENFHPNNIDLVSYPPLLLLREDSLNAIEKSQYINYYHEDAKDDSLLNLGGTNGIKIGNVTFSTGAYLHEGDIHKRAGTLDGVQDTITSKELEYKYNINNMADSKETERETLIHIGDGSGNKGKFQFGNNIYPDGFHNREVTLTEGEIIFVNDDSNKDIAIIGIGENPSIPSQVPANNRIRLSQNSLKGIIITKGDVYISGDVDYRGTIAAEGDIYFEDNYSKVITNDYNYILRAVFGTDKLKNQFRNNGDLVPFVFQSEAGVDDTGSFLNYEKVINVRWQQIR